MIVLNNEEVSFDTIPYEEIGLTGVSGSIVAKAIGKKIGDGLLISVDIAGDDKAIISEENKLLIQRNGNLLGEVSIPIGSAMPVIYNYDSYALLQIGNNAGNGVPLKGRNLICIDSIESVDGDVEIMDRRPVNGPNDQVLVMRALGNVEKVGIQLKFTYYELDQNSNQLSKKTFIKDLPIAIRPPDRRQISIKDNLGTFYEAQIVHDKQVLPISLAQPAGNDYAHFSVEPGSILSTSTEFDFPNNAAKEGSVTLVFRPELVRPGHHYAKVRANNQEYYIEFDILPNPVISRISGGIDDRAQYDVYEQNQQLIIEGTNLNYVYVLNNDQPVELKLSSSDKNQLIYDLSFHDKGMSYGDHYLPVVIGNDPKGSIPYGKVNIKIVPPSRPYSITSFCKISDGANPLNYSLLYDGFSTDKSVQLIIDPASVPAEYGRQSVEVTINYLDADGKLIKSKKHSNLSDGGYNLEVKPGIQPIMVNSTANDDGEYVVPWGYIELVVKHSDEFYRDHLDDKEVVIFKCWMKGKKIDNWRLSFTVPPGLIAYGQRGDKPMLQVSPLNVGFGIVKEFRDKNDKKSRFSVGTYLAGLNFGSSSRADAEGVDRSMFIQNNDIALMALGQVRLWSTGNVLVPLQFGVGYIPPFVEEHVHKAFFTVSTGFNFNSGDD